MAGTPIFDALARELGTSWRSTGEVPARGGPVDDEDVARSGDLEGAAPVHDDPGPVRRGVRRA